MTAYYNEKDKFAAAWLRELIRMGQIAPGVVDERSIEDIVPADLEGYTQCHFFAGIGVWSYALRRAGWPDDRPVWTGSCPCQPFSAAGKAGGFTDERHLWPHWLHLIQHGKPEAVPVFGEQVASKDGLGWLDLVQTDLEGADYASGALDLCAAGVGAPHIRQRLFFVAEWLGDSKREGLEGQRGGYNAAQGHGEGALRSATEAGELGRMADTDQQQWDGGRNARTAGRGELADGSSASGRPGPTNGLWRDADWLFCRDGKWRPTSPFPQPMADGSAESMGRVRDSRIQEFEEEINAATMETEGERAEILRDLWRSLEAEAKQSWTPGRLPGLHEAPFLLAFLRQLAEQRRGVSQCLFVSGEEALEEGVRGMWADNGSSRAPCERGLEGQQTREYSDALRVLSSILARHTQEAWTTNYQAYAESCFVLAEGAAARVGRLRGYGNAINAEVATAFIEAYLATIDRSAITR